MDKLNKAQGRGQKEMLGRFRNSFVEVDLKAVEHNYRTLQNLAKNCAMAPMVKADGYGHGDVQIARVCEKLGARYLGVVLVEEGIKLRMAGVQTPILVFGVFDSMGAEAIVKYRLTPVVSVVDQISKLKSSLHDTASYPVHVKFNTGMQRLGFEPEEADKVADAIGGESYLKLEGACTHFVSSDDFQNENGETVRQIKVFSKIKDVIQKRITHPVLYHYLNSGAILSGVKPQLDLARPGISLYGSLPKLQSKTDIELKPVMAVKSTVGFIHKVKKGEKVSYGGTWQASKDAVIAVVPMGYADGVPRLLSNRGKVLIRGEECPITGIVCMDYFMVDVTNIVDRNVGPLVGDEVVLLGSQKNKTLFAHDLASSAQTISYEILTGMQGRLPRIYLH